MRYADDYLIGFEGTDEQLAEFRKMASKPVIEEWIKENADKFDSQALFDFTSALFNE